MDFMQILPHKQTVWTHPSLAQSFNHREIITKQLFCFQLKQESDRIASWEIRVFFERERPTSNQMDIFI